VIGPQLNIEVAVDKKLQRSSNANEFEPSEGRVLAAAPEMAKVAPAVVSEAEEAEVTTEPEAMAAKRAVDTAPPPAALAETSQATETSVT